MILLASGTAGATTKAGAALAEVCLDLARQMADDAEGATKVVTVRVTGARTPAEAEKAARKVAESQLVKCSWYGEDPYWGRILSDLGTAGVDLDPERGIDRLRRHSRQSGHGRRRPRPRCGCRPHGEPGTWTSTATSASAQARSWVLTNDLTHAYIDENKGTS